MLRAVIAIWLENPPQALAFVSRRHRDVFNNFRARMATRSADQMTPPTAAAATPTATQVVMSTASPPAAAEPSGPPPGAARSPSAPPSVPPSVPPCVPPPVPPSAPPVPPRRAWHVGAIALTISSVGGVYLYRKVNARKESLPGGEAATTTPPPHPLEPPPEAAPFPPHVQYLIAGGGTAGFAALRAVRAAHPAAGVLVVGREGALPYMRPPLSKELWREPDLPARAASPDRLTFRQWNGKRRPLTYEPESFYTPVERLEAAVEGGAGGAAVARGWAVTRLDVGAHTALLSAPGHEPRAVRYDKCLIATGSVPCRVPELSEAAAAGRSLVLRGVGDVGRIAAALEGEQVRTVVIVGGGLLATELGAAMADRVKESGKRVMLLIDEPVWGEGEGEGEGAGEALPLGALLPRYLCREAARRLAAAGVALRRGRVAGAALPAAGGVRLRLAAAGGGEGEVIHADLVVECVGAEPEVALARASGLELHPELGGVVVNAELQARTDVWAAGDVSCYHDVWLGRRRVEHHDHAVLSGRRAGENMAASAAGAGARHYDHQSMFWSDLGPDLGYEAIGIIDSRLPTVGIFSQDAVSVRGELGTTSATTSVTTSATPTTTDEGKGPAEQGRGKHSDHTDQAQLIVQRVDPSDRHEQSDRNEPPERSEQGEARERSEQLERRYMRGVVLYLREKRVVGVLLWNLFNRMHVARQVVAAGEFDDLFEVSKLFAPHEQD